VDFQPQPSDQLEVFSRSGGGWLPVLAFEGGAGREATVQYANGGSLGLLSKIIDCDDPTQLRPAGGAAAAVAVLPTGPRLTLTVYECKGLKKMDTFGKNDVYVTAAVLPYDPWHTRQTSTVDGGGEAPVWPGGGEALVFDCADAPPLLRLAVFDEDEGSNDDLIGTRDITLGLPLLEKDFADEGWFTLTDKKKKPAGQVRLGVNWKLPAADPPAGEMSAMLAQARAISAGGSPDRPGSRPRSAASRPGSARSRPGSAASRPGSAHRPGSAASRGSGDDMAAMLSQARAIAESPRKG
jgi:hypothetical protein